MGILRHRFDCGIGPIGHQIPSAPCPGRLPLPAHGDPQGLWAPGTGGQAAQRPATRIARKPQRAARVPGAMDLDLGAPFDADDTGHAPRRQQAEERDIGTAPICRHADAPGSGGADGPCHRSPDDRESIALHAALQDRRIIGAPI